MNFRTQLPEIVSATQLNYQSKIVLVGSCFAENMADAFRFRAFETTVNPFGIVFNPISLAKVINKTICSTKFTINELVFYNDVYQCLDIHSKFKNKDAEVLLEELNKIQERFYTHLQTATHIFITLGTAWVYDSLETNQTVANCCKIPQKMFRKRILSIQEIESSLKNIVDNLLNFNSKATIIFTVSPVRHIKDGFVENQRSKAHLIAALHTVLEQYSTVEYFPSYELILDELRDYRFYTEDMLHPNQTAISYVWQRVTETYMDKKTQELMQEVEQLKKMMAHKPFDTSTVAYQKFLTQMEEKKVILSKKINKII